MSEITRSSDYRQAPATIKQHTQSLQKAGEFKPDYIGKLNVYLSAEDDQLRVADDHWPDPMRRQGQLDVKYALHDIHKPMGVSSFITKDIPLTVQSQLPPVEEIESELAQGHGETPSND
ncbi:PDDEXK nuclease domain-containing protein [Pseudomonas syringae]|uniref:PDDEXK nuclease domain-containing protein n=1 Tax=Pseudomonas TaxID=286 RepID=UPI00320A29B3